jgi:hypothetical protein
MPEKKIKSSPNKRGRKVKYTPELNLEIKLKLEKYINSTDIPIIAEFCYKNHVRKQRLYEIHKLSDSIKELIEKKEAQLEKLALNGEIDKTMAIFSLKQLGWTDKTEIEHSGDMNLIINGITKV